MAATGFTPISLYYSTTASAVPLAANLANGELALNTADMKLYAKNSSGVVTLLASNASTAAGVDSLSFGSTGLTPSTATTGAITVAGTLATTNGGTGRTSYTANSVLYASSTSAIASGSALTFDGTTLKVTSLSTGIELKQASAGSATYYVMDNTIETGGKRWRFGYTGAAGIPTFSLYNATDGVTSWIADSSGNFGIGISPVAKLDVGGSIRGYGLTVNSSSIIGGANQTTVDFLSGTGSRVIAWGANTTTKGSIRLVVASSDASAYVEGLTINSNAAIGVNGANYGTTGQVLTSGGSGAAPSWTTIAAGGGPFFKFGSTGGV